MKDAVARIINKNQGPTPLIEKKMQNKGEGVICAPRSSKTWDCTGQIIDYNTIRISQYVYIFVHMYVRPSVFDMNELLPTNLLLLVRI